MINEPAYGFLKSDREALAQALEAVRRRICVYNMGHRMDQDCYCDCKYGLSIDKLVSGDQRAPQGGSEQSGCPELRSVIYWLLHGEPDEPIDDLDRIYIAD